MREVTPEDREKRRLRQKEWRKNSKEIVAKLSERHYVKHKKEKLKKGAEWQKKAYSENINYKIAQRLRGRLSTALKSSKRSAHTLELLGCTVEELKIHLENLFQANMSWNNYGEWHIDHIRPCASFDLKEAEQQKLCFHYTNLQPLWGLDNLKKSDTYIVM